jgi:choline-glycine betaine transporter
MGRIQADGMALFAGKWRVLADWGVMGLTGFSILALGSREGGSEAGMALEAMTKNCEVKKNRWLAATTWFAGITVFALELGASVNYLQAAVERHSPNVMSFLPTVAMLLVSTGVRVAASLCSVEHAVQMLPLVGVPLALMAAGVLFERKAESV